MAGSARGNKGSRGSAAPWKGEAPLPCVALDAIGQVASRHRRSDSVMELKTRVFELSNGKYKDIKELAKAMGISLSHVYRVLEGKRGICRKFIIGAKKPSPNINSMTCFMLLRGKPE